MKIKHIFFSLIISLLVIISTGCSLFGYKYNYNKPFNYNDDDGKYSVVIENLTLDGFSYNEDGSKADMAGDKYLNVVVKYTNKGDDLAPPPFIGNVEFVRKSDGKVIEPLQENNDNDIQPNESGKIYYTDQALDNNDKVSDYILRIQNDGNWTEVKK